MSKRSFNTNTNNHDEWLTPPWLFNALGDFDLDVCEPVNPPWRIAKSGFNVLDNGLLQRWEGRVWCNPPYGRETFKWLARCAEHKNATALIFARTDTKGFHREVFRKAHSVFFMEGRVNFFTVDGNESDRSNAPSCLVSYSELNTQAIENSGLNGRLVLLHNGWKEDHGRLL